MSGTSINANVIFSERGKIINRILYFGTRTAIMNKNSIRSTTEEIRTTMRYSWKRSNISLVGTIFTSSLHEGMA